MYARSFLKFFVQEPQNFMWKARRNFDGRHRQRIAALRAYVVDGQGGADYMDRDENHWIVQQIATPMSIYPPYKATRTSFGINALKTLVIELEADDGTVGFGITTGGYPAAWLAVNHLNRFVVGKKVEEIEIMWDQMFKASLYYGRKGIVMNTISAIDLAAWDLLGRIRKEPVHAMIGGKVRDELEFYATGPRPDIAKELGFTVGRCHWFMPRLTGKMVFAKALKPPRLCEKRSAITSC